MFHHHSLIPLGSFRGLQEEKWGSFRELYSHTTWGKPNKEFKIHNVAIEHLLLLNMKLMAETARGRREWRLEFKRFRLCMV